MTESSEVKLKATYKLQVKRSDPEKESGHTATFSIYSEITEIKALGFTILELMQQ